MRKTVKTLNDNLTGWSIEKVKTSTYKFTNTKDEKEFEVRWTGKVGEMYDAVIKDVEEFIALNMAVKKGEKTVTKKQSTKKAIDDLIEKETRIMLDIFKVERKSKEHMELRSKLHAVRDELIQLGYCEK